MELQVFGTASRCRAIAMTQIRLKLKHPGCLRRQKGTGVLTSQERCKFAIAMQHMLGWRQRGSHPHPTGRSTMLWSCSVTIPRSGPASRLRLMAPLYSGQASWRRWLIQSCQRTFSTGKNAIGFDGMLTVRRTWGLAMLSPRCQGTTGSKFSLPGGHAALAWSFLGAGTD